MASPAIPTFDQFKAKQQTPKIPTLEQFKARQNSNPGQDWFAQHAPSSGDWFAAHAPSAIPPNPSDSIPAAKAPVPTGLQGPAPSRLSQAVTNLPYSVVNSLENTVKGPQMGGDDTFHPSTDGLSGFQRIGKFFEHPIDNTLDWAVNDPVSAAQQVAVLGKAGVEAAPAGAAGSPVATPRQADPLGIR